MKRKKILAISIVCVLLVGGGSVGGAAYYKSPRMKNGWSMLPRLST